MMISTNSIFLNILNIQELSNILVAQALVVKMEEKPSKALGGVSLNKKRKRDSQGVSRRTGVLAPTSVVVKQMTLARDICKPDDSCPDISKSLVSYYLNYKKSDIPKRLMFYKNGKWVDYAEDVVDLVKKDFKLRRQL